MNVKDEKCAYNIYFVRSVGLFGAVKIGDLERFRSEMPVPTLKKVISMFPQGCTITLHVIGK
jgi:hypothetical protein